MVYKAIIHVIDDEDAVRETLSLFLACEGYAVETHWSANSFFQTLNPNKTGCIITDIRMPGMSGIDLMTELHARHLDLPTIVVSAHADVTMAVEAMKKGAIDLLLKPFAGDSLLSCIGRALKRIDVQQAWNSEIQSIVKSFSALTNRERDVLFEVLEGRPNKIIAYNLNLSMRTVEVHRAAMMDKMRAKSLADLVRMSLVASLEKPGASPGVSSDALSLYRLRRDSDSFADTAAVLS